MYQPSLKSCGIMLVALVSSVWADDDPESSVSVQKAPAVSETLPRQIVNLTDLVMDHHIDPPTRQGMLLAGTKALFKQILGEESRPVAGM